MGRAHDVEDLKENILKVGFMIKEDRDYFSLSDVDMTTARYFIEYILEFCFEWDVPLSDKTVVLAKEVNNYLYLCLKYRRCAVCGRYADIHHHEGLIGAGRNRAKHNYRRCAVCGRYADIHHHEGLIGAGRNRAKHNHEESKFIALCRTHHTECHTLGHKTFENKYKLAAIKLNAQAIKELGIAGRNRAKHNHEESKFIALCRTHHTECHTLGHKTFENKYKLAAIKLNAQAIKELGI